MAALKQMSGEEFVRRVLGGERDFSGIELEEGFDLSGYDGFGEMQDYLGWHDLFMNPVLINGSKFYRVKAQGLYLPYAKGRKAVLAGADLKRADLSEADLEGADLEGAVLEGAVLEGVDLEGADLRRADLRGVRDLEYSIHLGSASYGGTIVTSEERRVIEKDLNSRILFDERADVGV